MSKKSKNILRKRNRNPKKVAADDNEDRIKAINLAMTNKNIKELRRLAITGPGFMNDGIRRLCWYLYIKLLLELIDKQ